MRKRDSDQEYMLNPLGKKIYRELSRDKDHLKNKVVCEELIRSGADSVILKEENLETIVSKAKAARGHLDLLLDTSRSLEEIAGKIGIAPPTAYEWSLALAKLFPECARYFEKEPTFPCDVTSGLAVVDNSYRIPLPKGTSPWGVAIRRFRGRGKKWWYWSVERGAPRTEIPERIRRRIRVKPGDLVEVRYYARLSRYYAATWRGND